MKPTTRFARSIREAIGLSAAAIALAAVPVSSMASIVCSSAPISIPANIDGVYFNLVTVAGGTSAAAVPGWDINLYMTGTSALYFFWPSTPANTAGGASTATVYDALSAGATIGPAQTYIVNSGGGGAAPFVNWQTAQTGKYLGIRFQNEATSAINYAWLQLNTGASGGFPATINGYCYDNTGVAIIAGDTGVVVATPSLAVTSSGTPNVVGDSVTFTGTLTGNGTLTGAGNVTFCADAPTTNATCGGVTPLCTVPATTAATACSTSALTAGTHSISAYFSGDANNQAATSPPLTQVTTPQFTLTVDDGSDFAAYGQTVNYVATLTNNGASSANAVSVTFAASAGLDAANLQWNCSGTAGTACQQDPGDQLHWVAGIPAHGSVTWTVQAPVLANATDDGVTFSVSAGAASASDTDTLVIFRDGFDDLP